MGMWQGGARMLFAMNCEVLNHRYVFDLEIAAMADGMKCRQEDK